MSTFLGSLSSLVWAWLLVARGRFWHAGPTLSDSADGHTAKGQRSPAPPVTIVIPARNEEEHIAESLASLLAQDYSGPLRVLLVDDNSTDATGYLAQGLAERDPRLRIIQGQPLPSGWSGKMWAVSQALAQPEAVAAAWVLLTDADILHGPSHVARLVAKARRRPEARLQLVSEMVALRTESLAERALIPAFVFFFQMLYPFQWVNSPRRTTAAAAGGTMLVSRQALGRIGNVDAIRDALIDDVALAAEVKRGGHAIWLGHADEATSLRAYPRFQDIFDMIARTAYVQLQHSPLLLCGTVAGMALLYVQPVILSVFGRRKARVLGLLSWSMMAVAFQPTLRRYRRSPLWGLALPGIALFYTAATVGSAVRHYKGNGGHWKGRAYS